MNKKRDYKKEYERRKDKLLKKPLGKIPTGYVPLVRLVVKLLKSNLKAKKDRQLLIDALKRLERYHNLSIENIRYLILREYKGNSEMDAKELMNLNQGRKKTKKEIRKLKQLLKEQGIKFTPIKYSYKDFSDNPNIGMKVLKEKTFRFFKIG